MKKLISLLICIVAIYIVTIPKDLGAQALRVLLPVQGGTGISTSSPTDIGKCIKVLSDSPFKYELASCGGIGGDPTIIQIDGTPQSVGTPTLNFTGNSFAVTESPADTFTLRVSTTTLGLLASSISDFVSTVRTSISETIEGLTYTSGTGVLSLDSGYTIPTTTRAVAWDNKGNGTVTSVDMSVPTGLTITGNPISTSGTLALTLTSGYTIPSTTRMTNADTAFSWGNHALSGYILADGTRSLTANWFPGNYSIYGLNSLTLTGTSTLGYASTTALSVVGNATLGYLNTTSTTGTSTFSGAVQIGSTAGANALRVNSLANHSNSTSVGGAVNITNTNSTGAGLVIYSNQGATASGRLLVIRADNTAFDEQALWVQQDGTNGAFFIDCTASSSRTIECGSISSVDPDNSALGISGSETGKGTVKITHTGTGTDVNASGLSIDLQGTGTASQGIYLTSTGGGTTGNLLTLRNGVAQDYKFLVTGAGNVGIATSSPSRLLTIAGGDAWIGGNLTATGTALFGYSSSTALTVSGSTYLGSLSGLLKGTAGLIGTASNGTDYTLITGTTCSGSDKVSAISASGAVTCTSDISGGGSGSISTSTIPTAGKLTYWTSASQLSDVATGTLTESVTGLELDATRGLVGGSAVLGLTSGYTIPTTTRADNWDTAFGWGNHALAGYGNVSKVGTPVDNQIGVWTGDGTIEGDAGLTFDGGLGITVSDTENKVGFTINQNDATNRPASIESNRTASSGYSMILNQTNDAQFGSFIKLKHISSSPQSADSQGIDFYFNSSTGNERAFSSFSSFVIDATDGAEYGGSYFNTRRNGTSRTMLRIGSKNNTTELNGLSVGDSIASAIIQSAGSQDLILQTGNTTTGNITIVDGANGDVQVNPNGTGRLVTTASTLGFASSTALTVSGNTVLASATSTNLFSTLGTFTNLVVNTLSTFLNVTITGLLDIGAGVLEIPNGTAPVIDSIGEIGLDSTDDQLIMADGGGTARVFGTDEFRVVSLTMASSSLQFDSGDLLAVLGNKDGLEITQFRCYVVGGTSKVVNLTDGTNDTETITCGTTMTSDTDVATNDTFTADEIGSLEMGATTGTVNYLHFEAWARITRE